MRPHDGYNGAAEQHAAGRRYRGAGLGTTGKIPRAPDCENERLQRLIYHGFQALSQAPSGQGIVEFGYFCLPPDGDLHAPLWQNVCIKREYSDGQVTLTFDR